MKNFFQQQSNICFMDYSATILLQILETSLKAFPSWNYLTSIPPIAFFIGGIVNFVYTLFVHVFWFGLAYMFSRYKKKQQRQCKFMWETFTQFLLNLSHSSVRADDRFMWYCCHQVVCADSDSDSAPTMASNVITCTQSLQVHIVTLSAHSSNKSRLSSDNQAPNNPQQ